MEQLDQDHQRSTALSYAEREVMSELAILRRLLERIEECMVRSL
jgi:hypothetical protein